MIIVSQSADAKNKLYNPLTLCFKTKHAAELCALLVSDFYGELPSVCFTSMM